MIGSMHSFDVNDLNNVYASIHTSDLESLPILNKITSSFVFELIEEEDSGCNEKNFWRQIDDNILKFGIFD